MASLLNRPAAAVVLTCMVVAARAFLARIEQCEPIEIPRCRAMPYNMTQMPNLLHHGTQENARLVFEKFEVLLDQRCSDVLLFLLCSLHVPICAVSLQPEAIPPCRSVCEKARAGCEPLMNSYNVSWPDSLECSRLPRYERGVCVSPEAFVKPTQKKKAGCKACKKKKPTLAHMKKYKYDYAIKGHVLKGKRVGNSEVIYRVKVAQVAFSEKVKFQDHDEVTMWVNSTCPCPKMHKGRDYLVMGHGDGVSSKLMLTPSSVVAKWRDPLSTKLKKWQQRLRAHSSKPADKTKTANDGDRGKKRRKGGAVLIPGGSSREDVNPQGVPVKHGNPKSPSSLSDFVNGYTHGGRYYTKELAKKYNQAALRAASD